MKPLNLSSRALHAFLTLATCRSFTVAAERCHMSQSAFSQLIGRMEEEIGARLFDRTSRSVSLSQEGQIFLPAAKNMIVEIDSVTADIRAHTEGRRGKVSIAALPSLCASWIPQVLAKFRIDYPEIQTRLFDVQLERIQSLVREGAVDFGINADAGTDEEFESQLIFKDSFFLVCRPDHPLAHRKAIVVADLKGHDYIHTMRSASMWQRIYPFLNNVGAKDTGFEVSNFSTLAGLVANGIGVSIVAGAAISQFKVIGMLAIPVKEKDLSYEVQLIKRRNRTLPSAALIMCDQLKKSAAESAFLH
ncbi:MAG: LysR family transcriptional regulator [Pseudomonadota bacterium]